MASLLCRAACVGSRGARLPITYGRRTIVHESGLVLDSGGAEFAPLRPVLPEKSTLVLDRAHVDGLDLYLPLEKPVLRRFWKSVGIEERGGVWMCVCIVRARLTGRLLSQTNSPFSLTNEP